MIRFIPQIKDISSPLSDPEGFANNAANKSLAAQTENKFGEKSCLDHPNFENEMLVHFSVSGDIMTVQVCCCDKFKDKLIKLCQNQNPF